MQDIKDLNLTARDFDLLVDGLETLPEKGAAGEILETVFSSMLLKDGPEAEGYKAKREHEKRKKDAEKEIIKEEVRILQGKLLQMKRYMQANNLLKEASTILDGPNG